MTVTSLAALSLAQNLHPRHCSSYMLCAFLLPPLLIVNGLGEILTQATWIDSCNRAKTGKSVFCEKGNVMRVDLSLE